MIGAIVAGAVVMFVGVLTGYAMAVAVRDSNGD